MSIVAAAVLVAASVMDARTREVPVWYFPAAGIVQLIMAGGYVPPAFLWLVPIYFGICLVGRFGGADALCLSYLALVYGAWSLYPALLAFAGAALLMVVRAARGRRGPVAFIPCVLAGCALCWFWMALGA